MAFLGELGLDGAIRAVPGAVPLVDALPGEVAVVPVASAVEAWLVGRHRVRPVARLAELIDAFAGTRRGRTTFRRAHPSRAPAPDLADVRGQPLARQALEIAAAGGHHLLLVGPPGRGQDDARQAPAGPAARSRSRRRACRPPVSTRRPGSRSRPAAWCGGRPSALRTTAPASCRWSAAGPTRSGPGEVEHGARRRVVPRRARRVPAGACSTRCASRSRKAWSA